MHSVNSLYAGVECFGIALAKLGLAEMTFHLGSDDVWFNLEVIS